MNSEKTIAFFDFDGTLTRKDSLLGFLFYSFGSFKTLKGLLMLFPNLLLYLLGLRNNSNTKEKIYSFFFLESRFAN